MKLISLLFILSSCALAPFSSTSTGRTFGAGTPQFEIGNTASNYFLKMSYGLTENLDLGYFFEFGNITTSGISTKYSLLNNPQGYATALELAYGGITDSNFTTFAWINSYNLGNGVEFFLNTRINNVNSNKDEIDLNRDYKGLKFLAYDVTYYSFTYGVNLWITSNLGMSLSGTLHKGDDIENNSSIFSGSILLNI